MTDMGTILGVFDLVKKLKEAYEKADQAQVKAIIAEFQNMATDAKLEVINAKEEIIKLREENLKLKKQTETKKDLVQKKNKLYYTKANEGPFCPRCYEADNKKISLHDQGNSYWMCPECDHTFHPEERSESHFNYNQTDDELE
jgi:hypothetical protein